MEVTSTGGGTQVTRIPTGGVQAGGGATAGIEAVGLLQLGAGLLLGAAVTALPRRRRRPTAR